MSATGRLPLPFSLIPSGIGLVTFAGGPDRARGADSLAACSARPTADLRAEALARATCCAALSEAAFAWAAVGAMAPDKGKRYAKALG